MICLIPLLETHEIIDVQCVKFYIKNNIFLGPSHMNFKALSHS